MAQDGQELLTDPFFRLIFPNGIHLDLSQFVSSLFHSRIAPLILPA